MRYRGNSNRREYRLMRRVARNIHTISETAEVFTVGDIVYKREGDIYSFQSYGNQWTADDRAAEEVEKLRKEAQK